VSRAAALMDRLGLSDEELCTILDTDPLSVITDDLDHRPEVKILLALTDGIDESVLRRWLRTGPLDLLLRRDFAAFEDALVDLRERGLVIRKRGDR
jgi:hypothetical protein